MAALPSSRRGRAGSRAPLPPGPTALACPCWVRAPSPSPIGPVIPRPPFPGPGPLTTPPASHPGPRLVPPLLPWVIPRGGAPSPGALRGAEPSARPVLSPSALLSPPPGTGPTHLHGPRQPLVGCAGVGSVCVARPLPPAVVHWEALCLAFLSCETPTRPRAGALCPAVPQAPRPRLSRAGALRPPAVLRDAATGLSAWRLGLWLKVRSRGRAP